MAKALRWEWPIWENLGSDLNVEVKSKGGR